MPFDPRNLNNATRAWSEPQKEAREEKEEERRKKEREVKAIESMAGSFASIAKDLRTICEQLNLRRTEKKR